jgi:hypothetical protein
MYLLGHTDAKLTLSVYQQVLDMGAGSIDVLETVLGCSLQEACDVLNGRGSRGHLIAGAANDRRSSPAGGFKNGESPDVRGVRESG